MKTYALAHAWVAYAYTSRDQTPTRTQRRPRACGLSIVP
jgi:hypothetical protein